MIGLRDPLPSTHGSMSASAGLLASSQTASGGLPRATLERSAATTLGATRPRFLEVNEEDPDSLLGKGAFGRTHVGRLHSVGGRKAERVA
eukprot:4904807-Amphidinium_carterae.1